MEDPNAKIGIANPQVKTRSDVVTKIGQQLQVIQLLAGKKRSRQGRTEWVW
jgi:hypothetical protein